MIIFGWDYEFLKKQRTKWYLSVPWYISLFLWAISIPCSVVSKYTSSCLLQNACMERQFSIYVFSLWWLLIHGYIGVGMIEKLHLGCIVSYLSLYCVYYMYVLGKELVRRLPHTSTLVPPAQVLACTSDTCPAPILVSEAHLQPEGRSECDLICQGERHQGRTWV